MTMSEAPRAEALVQIRGVGASYGTVRALDDVTLDIGDNEFFALLGPSGCGKTTLLRALAGFELPTEGSITLGGEDLLALPAHRRPVNMMFQSYALFPHLTVTKNIGYGPARAGISADETSRRVAEVIEVVGLGGLENRRPSQLSGGQRQRVALARAIVNRPRLLLLDEPLSALDRNVRSQMQLELKRLQHEVGIAFVMVTHDQEEAMSMADRVAVLADGRVQQVAAPADMYQHPANRFVAEFIGQSNVFEGTPTTGGLAIDGRVLPGHGDGQFLVVRPESIRISDAGEVAGTVLETQFTSGQSTIAVQPTEVATATGRPILLTEPGFNSLERGAEVRLTWDADAAVLVP